MIKIMTLLIVNYAALSVLIKKSDILHMNEGSDVLPGKQFGKRHITGNKYESVVYEDLA